MESGNKRVTYPYWFITDVKVVGYLVPGLEICVLKLLRPESLLNGQYSTDEHILGPIQGKDAAAIRNNVSEAVVTYACDLLEEWGKTGAFETMSSSLKAILEKERWITFSDRDELKKQKDGLLLEASTQMPLAVLLKFPIYAPLRTSGVIDHPAFPNYFYDNSLPKDIDRHNKNFLARERERYRDMFEHLEKYPLSDEQTTAAICAEDRVLLAAAAGSGKTSTMVAKTGYFARSGLAQPEEILMLSFNNDAVGEMRERVDRNLAGWVEEPENISISTFHAFGLKVLGQVSGAKPRMATWADDNNSSQTIMNFMTDRMNEDPVFSSKVITFIAMLGQHIDFSEDDDKESRTQIEKENREHEDELIHRKLPPVALPGEVLMQWESVFKSRQELMIGRFLKLNGVKFQYERSYEVDTADDTHSQYHPDFFYPEAKVEEGEGLYHEHFALDKGGYPPPKFKNYMEGVEWKRALHREQNTTLIETTSAGFYQGARLEGIEHLAAELSRHGVPLVPDIRNLELTQKRGKAVMKLEGLARLIRTFMIHFKNNCLTMDDVRKKARDTYNFQYRSDTFLDIFETVFEDWNNKLRANNEVDFEDMLVLATEAIEKDKYISPYKLVSVDEFQDTSSLRARMIKAMNRQGSQLFAVGDDYQAINGFAGANVSYMMDFEQLIGKAQTYFLTQTFRCPQYNNDVANRFVSKNPRQIKKDVHSHNPLTGNTLEMVAVEPFQVEESIYDRISWINNIAREENGQLSVMILGRYRFDRPKNFLEMKRDFPDLSITVQNCAWIKGRRSRFCFSD